MRLSDREYIRPLLRICACRMLTSSTMHRTSAATLLVGLALLCAPRKISARASKASVDISGGASSCQGDNALYCRRAFLFTIVQTLRSGGDGSNGLECDIVHACCMIVLCSSTIAALCPLSACRADSWRCTSEQTHISLKAGHAASCRCVECWRIQHISIERLSFVISGHQPLSELQQLQLRSVFE